MCNVFIARAAQVCNILYFYLFKLVAVMWCFEAVPCLEAALRQIFTALALKVDVLVLALLQD